jgi:hypothetical protein
MATRNAYCFLDAHGDVVARLWLNDACRLHDAADDDGRLPALCRWHVCKRSGRRTVLAARAHYCNGALHRVGAPARETYYANGILQSVEYWLFGVLDNADGPALVSYHRNGSVAQVVHVRYGRLQRGRASPHLPVAQLFDAAGRERVRVVPAACGGGGGTLVFEPPPHRWTAKDRAAIDDALKRAWSLYEPLLTAAAAAVKFK